MAGVFLRDIALVDLLLFENKIFGYQQYGCDVQSTGAAGAEGCHKAVGQRGQGVDAAEYCQDNQPVFGGNDLQVVFRAGLRVLVDGLDKGVDLPNGENIKYHNHTGSKNKRKKENPAGQAAQQSTGGCEYLWAVGEVG